MTALTQIGNNDTGLATRTKLNGLITEFVDVTAAPFNATGDGVTDDLAAIQAAFDWTTSSNRGTLYFPPGTYYVSGPINISTPISFVHIRGSMGATIIGNFADYIISRYRVTTYATSGGHVVEKLTIINQHAGGGGIRMGMCVGAAIRDCDVTADFCISTDNSDVFGPPIDPGFGDSGADAYWYSLEVSISNCNLRPYNDLAVNSTGIVRGADGPTTNCTFKNFDTAVRAYGGQGGHSYKGCYFERNNIGMSNQTGPGTATPGATGGTGIEMSSCHFKNNGIAIAYGAAAPRYSGILIEATEGAIPGNPQYGIYLPDGGGGNGVFEGISVRGQYQIAGIRGSGGEVTVSSSYWSGVSSVNTSTLGGVDWIQPLTAASADYLGCSVSPVWTMIKLPAKTYTIASATWSAGTATITVVGGPGDLPGGQLANVTISGMTPSGYNGTFSNATVPNFFTFTYPVADPGGPGSVMGTVFFTTVDISSHKPNAYEGYAYDVSDADTATWGAAALPGGSNRCKVRYTPSAWTVMGK